MTLDDGIYLGRGTQGIVTSGAQRSTMVLGPTRSGKTTSLILPNLALSTRPSVTTSTKPDILEIVAKSSLSSPLLLFDPSGEVPCPVGVQRVGYSPVHQAQTWDGAILATRSIVDVARHRRVGGDDHWTERAIALIAPLLRASFLEKTSLSLLSEQVDRRLADRATAVLRDSHGPSHPSVTMLESVLATEEREQSSIWSTASGLFAGLRTDAARSAAQASPLDLETFFSHASQLHIVAPSRHQAVSVPLIVGLIEHLVHATYERHSTGARLLLALDELANVAPLPKLAGIVSEGGGQGVVTLACLQDLSQARQRWGTAAEGFVSLFPSTIALPGIADRTTLELIEKLSGTQSHVQRGVTFDGRGRRRGHQLTTLSQPLLHSSAIARGRAGHGLVLSADKSLQWVTLTPSFKTEPFRSLFAA